MLRSWLGRQERWQVWRPLDPVPSDAQACHLSASTVERWLDQAGATAMAGVAEQLVGVESCGQMATDGVWARLRERYGKGRMPRTVNTITGPSRTGDIEQTIELGAHGPRRVHILVVRE